MKKTIRQTERQTDREQRPHIHLLTNEVISFVDSFVRSSILCVQAFATASGELLWQVADEDVAEAAGFESLSEQTNKKAVKGCGGEKRTFELSALVETNNKKQAEGDKAVMVLGGVWRTADTAAAVSAASSSSSNGARSLESVLAVPLVASAGAVKTTSGVPMAGEGAVLFQMPPDNNNMRGGSGKTRGDTT